MHMFRNIDTGVWASHLTGVAIFSIVDGVGRTGVKIKSHALKVQGMRLMNPYDGLSVGLIPD